jgi:hypothetical protein
MTNLTQYQQAQMQKAQKKLLVNSPMESINVPVNGPSSKCVILNKAPTITTFRMRNSTLFYLIMP